MRKGIDGLAAIVQGKLLLDSFKRTRDEIFKDLPVEEVIHKADTVCPECQSEMKVIGKEYIREELVYVPQKYIDASIMQKLSSALNVVSIQTNLSVKKQ